jgi:protein-disulfide isomerase
MTKDSYWLGAANPKVTIIEFGDFACLHCKEAFPIIREIITKYKANVKFIFKDFPVVSADSASLALAARCAGEQGLFWPMYDKLYINQGVTQQNELLELAKEIGANPSRFTSCLAGKKYTTQINQDFQDGTSLGVGGENGGTPTWFINGYKIEGTPPHDTFVKMVEGLLK